MFLPKFNDPYLKEIARNLKRQQKSITSGAYVVSCQRVREPDVEGWLEIVEISINNEDHQIYLRLWSNRWILLEATLRQTSWTMEGRLLGDIGGRRLIDNLRATQTIACNSADADDEEFLDIWNPVIARGPHIVRD